MTDLATATCPTCGAAIFSTKFCETCGSALSAAPAPQTATETPAEPAVTTAYPAATVGAFAVAPPRRRGTALRVIALVLILIGNFLPTFFSIGNPLSFELGLYNGAYVAVEIVGGMLLDLFLLLAAVTGSAGAGGKALGVTFALVNAGITLIEAFDPQAMQWTNSSTVMNAFAALALFLSWATGRPFRGPGYFGLFVLALFEVLNYYSDYGIETTVFGLGGAVLVGLVASAFLLSFVGLVILFERRHTAIPL